MNAAFPIITRLDDHHLLYILFNNLSRFEMSRITVQISICYNLSINSTIGAFPIEEKDNRKIILEKKNCIFDFFFLQSTCSFVCGLSFSIFFWRVFFWWQHCPCGLRALEPIRALKDVVHVRDVRKAEALKMFKRSSVLVNLLVTNSESSIDIYRQVQYKVKYKMTKYKGNILNTKVETDHAAAAAVGNTRLC
jgi:hypothetical protein